jgi:hypothetical protein
MSHPAGDVFVIMCVMLVSTILFWWLEWNWIAISAAFGAGICLRSLLEDLSD